MERALYAGIDAGGTEFKCIVASSPEHIVAEQTVSIGHPDDTLAECAGFFQQTSKSFGPLKKLGIGSFGPLNLDRNSPTYGHITSTPKPHWSNTDIVGYFHHNLKLPVAFETDVNAALLGEARWGAAQGLHSAVYVTVGTGIGAGVMIDGNLIHGAMHTETGHMLLPRHRDDTFHGLCPFHGACLEGLASGPAIAERWQESPKTMVDTHAAWSLQAHYLATMCVNLVLMYSPQKLLLGGGVMNRLALFPAIHQSFRSQMNSYIKPTIAIEEFIVPPHLGNNAGAMGAIALALGG